MDFGAWGGWRNYCLKLFINNRVFMVLNNCKGIEDYVRALKNIFWVMGVLAKLLLKIVINNRVFMVVNNCKNIENYCRDLKK